MRQAQGTDQDKMYPSTRVASDKGSVGCGVEGVVVIAMHRGTGRGGVISSWLPPSPPPNERAVNSNSAESNNVTDHLLDDKLNISRIRLNLTAS
jgi:hypothetical protein